MTQGAWPEEIRTPLGAAITSQCIHIVPDPRKEVLFTEIFERLAPGGWYLNLDPVTTENLLVADAWRRAKVRWRSTSISLRSLGSSAAGSGVGLSTMVRHVQAGNRPQRESQRICRPVGGGISFIA